MPYIKKEDREWLWSIGDREPKNPGELNYLITTLLRRYWNAAPGPQNYQRINDIIGALEGAKLEFYRRIAAPYEDTKIKENGDVY